MKFTELEVSVINALVGTKESMVEALEAYKANPKGRKLSIKHWKDGCITITGHNYVIKPVNATTNYKPDYYKAMKKVFIPEVKNLNDMATLAKKCGLKNAVQLAASKPEAIRYNVGDTFQEEGCSTVYEVTKVTAKTMVLTAAYPKLDYESIDSNFTANIIDWDWRGADYKFRLNEDNKWVNSKFRTLIPYTLPTTKNISDNFKRLPKVGEVYCGDSHVNSTVDEQFFFKVTEVNGNKIKVRRVELEYDMDTLRNRVAGPYRIANLKETGNLGEEESWTLWWSCPCWVDGVCIKITDKSWGSYESYGLHLVRFDKGEGYGPCVYPDPVLKVGTTIKYHNDQLYNVTECEGLTFKAYPAVVEKVKSVKDDDNHVVAGIGFVRTTYKATDKIDTTKEPITITCIDYSHDFLGFRVTDTIDVMEEVDYFEVGDYLVDERRSCGHLLEDKKMYKVLKRHSRDCYELQEVSYTTKDSEYTCKYNKAQYYTPSNNIGKPFTTTFSECYYDTGIAWDIVEADKIEGSTISIWNKDTRYN